MLETFTKSTKCKDHLRSYSLVDYWSASLLACYVSNIFVSFQSAFNKYYFELVYYLCLLYEL